MNRFHCTIQKGEINLFTWPQHVLAVILYWRVKIRLAYISCKVFFSQLKIFDYYFKVIFRITIQYDKREFKSPGRRLAEDKIE